MKMTVAAAIVAVWFGLPVNHERTDRASPMSEQKFSGQKSEREEGERGIRQPQFLPEFLAGPPEC